MEESKGRREGTLRESLENKENWERCDKDGMRERKKGKNRERISHRDTGKKEANESKKRDIGEIK